MRARYRSWSVIAAVLSAPAMADQPPPIVVTGRGLADPATDVALGAVEIDRERLLNSASGRIENVLASVAGVQQFRRSDSRSANPSAQGLTLRALGGNASSRTLVTLDGVPLTDPFFGFVPLSAIAPERLASVRVTRGGGPGAVAGTIALASAGRDELGPVSGQALIDDRGDSELSGSLAPRLGTGFAVASLRWDRGPGFWTTPASQRVPASVRARYDSWSAGLRLVAPLSDLIELQARGLAYADHRTLRFDGADSRSTGQDASLRIVGRGAWQFEALGYIQARDFANVVISATTFTRTLDQRATPSTGLGGKFELRPPELAGHALRLGVDWRLTSGDLDEVAYSGATGQVTARRRAGGRNGDLGFYLDDDWTLGRLLLSAGARADRWTMKGGYFRETNAAGVIASNLTFADRTGWNASLHGGALLHAGATLDVRAASYTGFRQPTLNELYRPFVVFPVTTRANAALRNERLVGAEAGIDWRPAPGVALSATVFDNRLRDAIANVTIAPNLRERRNVTAIHARGAELALAATRATVSLDGSLAWTKARVEDASGLNRKRPAQTPRLAAGATLAWRPAPRWRIATTLRHTGAQFEDDLETDILPAATTLDAFAEVPLGERLSLILRGENLTSTQVITRNQAGSIDLGTPRTVWIGLRVGR